MSLLILRKHRLAENHKLYTTAVFKEFFAAFAQHQTMCKPPSKAEYIFCFSPYPDKYWFQFMSVHWEKSTCVIVDGWRSWQQLCSSACKLWCLTFESQVLNSDVCMSYVVVSTKMTLWLQCNTHNHNIKTPTLIVSYATGTIVRHLSADACWSSGEAAWHILASVPWLLLLYVHCVLHVVLVLMMQSNMTLSVCVAIISKHVTMSCPTRL